MTLGHLNNHCRLFVFLWRVSFSAFLCSWSMSSSNSHLLKAKLKILWPLYDLILGSILIIKFSSHRWSWWLTLFILFVVTLIFICFIFYVLLSRDYQTLTESSIFSELVNGLKESRVSKFYCFVFMIHRILIVAIFIIEMSTKSIFISAIWIQLVYLIFMIFTRPFNSAKSNIDKISLEMVILVLFKQLT